MRLLDILKKEAIIPDLKARHKKEALEELSAAIAAAQGIEKGPLLDVLLDRERLGSTGIGDGIAIPHGKNQNGQGFGRGLRTKPERR